MRYLLTKSTTSQLRVAPSATGNFPNQFLFLFLFLSLMHVLRNYTNVSHAFQIESRRSRKSLSQPTTLQLRVIPPAIGNFPIGITVSVFVLLASSTKWYRCESCASCWVLSNSISYAATGTRLKTSRVLLFHQRKHKISHGTSLPLIRYYFLF